jgi:hypothetical protein
VVDFTTTCLHFFFPPCVDRADKISKKVIAEKKKKKGKKKKKNQTPSNPKMGRLFARLAPGGFATVLLLIACIGYSIYAADTARRTFLRETPSLTLPASVRATAQEWDTLPLHGLYTRYIAVTEAAPAELLVAVDPTEADAGMVIYCAGPAPDFEPARNASGPCAEVRIAAQWSWEHADGAEQQPQRRSAGLQGSTTGLRASQRSTTTPLAHSLMAPPQNRTVRLTPCPGCRGDCVARIVVSNPAAAAVSLMVEADSEAPSAKICTVSSAIFAFLIVLPAVMLVCWVLCWLAFVVAYARPLVVVACGLPVPLALAIHAGAGVALAAYFGLYAATAVDWRDETYVHMLSVNVVLAGAMAASVAASASLAQQLACAAGGGGGGGDGGGVGGDAGSPWTILGTDGDAADGEDVELTAGIDPVAAAEDQEDGLPRSDDDDEEANLVFT